MPAEYRGQEYISFSGSDAVASAVFAGAAPIVMGALRGISYSDLRFTIPVMTLGKGTVSGFARGHLTVAGTLIFTALYNRHWVRDVIERVPYLRRTPWIKPQELPPFDIVVTVANEYGQAGGYVIYGARIIDEGQVISEEDAITENVVTFQAVDFYPMNRLEIMAEGDGPAEFAEPSPFRVTNLFE